MKNSDRYKFRIFLKTKLISVSIFEFYTERYIIVYTVYHIPYMINGDNYFESKFYDRSTVLCFEV